MLKHNAAVARARAVATILVGAVLFSLGVAVASRIGIARAASSATFGNSTVASKSTWASPNYKFVSRFTLTEAGSIQKLSVYAFGTGSSGSQPLRAVVYADAAGQPGALKAVSQEVTLPYNAARGWVDLALPSAVSLPAGDYWLGFHAGTPTGNALTYFGFNYAPGAARSKYDTYADGLSDPFGAAASKDRQIAVYATYVALGSASTTTASGTTTGATSTTATTGTTTPGTTTTTPTTTTPPPSGYFVAPTGSDSNPGTFDQPWQTIGHAMASIQPGSTAYIRTGTYVEGGTGNTLDWSRSGVAGAPLTIAAYPGEKPEIDTRFKLTGDYLTIKGVGVGKNTHMGNVDVGDVCVWLAGDHDAFTDGDVHGCNQSGVFTTGTNFVVARDYIHDNGNPAHIEGSQPLDHGIYMGGSGGVASDNLVVRNTGYGIQFWPSCSSCKAVENTIAYNGTASTGGYGFLFGGGSDSVLADNIIAFNRGDGVHSYTASGATADTNLVYGNSGPDGSQQYCTGCGGFTVANPISSDPLFASTSDYRVQGLSKAVDAAGGGYASASALDGAARPVGGGPDVGAYER